jgi:hypothetical protein
VGVHGLRAEIHRGRAGSWVCTIFAKLAPLFAKQYSISRAMRETGHSFYVVRKYFRKMQAIRAGQDKGRPG